MNRRNYDWGGNFPSAPYAYNAQPVNMQGAVIVPKKKSGAKFGYGKEKNEYVSGWNISRSRGFISLIASPLTPAGIKANRERFGGDYDFETTSRTGRVYQRWLATVEFRQTGQTVKFSAYFDKSTFKLYIPKLGMVASCRAKNGGYFGKSHVSKNARNAR